ncbi:MAG: site-specific integrase [Fimbriimonadaceae bacterium]|nr:site-specific integrase [Fimbriimonadaceae bacterium]
MRVVAEPVDAKGLWEVVLYRKLIWLPQQVDDTIQLKRVPIYGATSELCEAKATALRNASPFVLDLTQSRVFQKVNLATLRESAEVQEKFASGEWSISAMVQRAKENDLPTLRQLAEQAIETKASSGKNVVSDRAHLGKLDLSLKVDGQIVKLGKLRVSEIRQSHITTWVRTLASVNSKRTGKPLGEHSIELAIALVKLAWSQLTLDENTVQYADSLTFANLRKLYEREVDPFIPIEPVDLVLLESIRELKDLTPVEAAAFALLLQGLRMNEVGAIRWEDIVVDEQGRQWVEPVGSISKAGRIWRPRTKIGVRENRSLPLTSFQVRLLEPARGCHQSFACGEPLLDTDSLRRLFEGLLVRAGKALPEKQFVRTIRHTVLTLLADRTDDDVADYWGHGKLPSTMVGKRYNLAEMRQKRRQRRKNVTFADTPACDYLPWAQW